MEYVKDPHTTVFTGSTGCGKTKKALDLIENEYRHCFDNIVILCPNIDSNATFQNRSWVWQDPYVFLFPNPIKCLVNMVEKISLMLKGEST